MVGLVLVIWGKELGKFELILVDMLPYFQEICNMTIFLKTETILGLKLLGCKSIKLFGVYAYKENFSRERPFSHQKLFAGAKLHASLINSLLTNNFFRQKDLNKHQCYSIEGH